MSLTNTNTITNTITNTKTITNINNINNNKILNNNINKNIKEKEIYKEKDVLTDVKCNSFLNSSSSIEDNSNTKRTIPSSNLTKQEQDNLIQLEEEIYNHQQLKDKLQQFNNDEKKLQWCINTYTNWKANMQENYKSIIIGGWFMLSNTMARISNTLAKIRKKQTTNTKPSNRTTPRGN